MIWAEWMNGIASSIVVVTAAYGAFAFIRSRIRVYAAARQRRLDDERLIADAAERLGIKD